MSGQSGGCIYSANWQSWGKNQHVEVRKPGRAALGSFETCFWNLKGIEDFYCNSHFLQGHIGLCCVYILVMTEC